jgi:hypothetical protein
MPFQKGNDGGPGRPRKETERRYLKSLIGCVPIARWRAVVKRALADAEAGDAKARDWLSRHLTGDQPLQLLAQEERLDALEAAEQARQERER